MATATTERTEPGPKPRTTRTRADGSNSEKSAGGSTGALIGAAAAGVALGVAAMIGRKVAVQAPTVLAGDWDQALAAEHAATLKVFDAIQATTRENTTKRAILLAQLKHALAKHALQEENAVYPALRDAGQAEAADHLNNDHGYVKQYLYELTNCPRDSERFLEIVRKFRVDLEKHIAEEENELFPSLKAKLSEEANKALTKAMNKEGFKLA
jgi:hemerythrin superfamily protein